ncbi:hypothetical protein VTK73DRAFT_9589 [Phialemonium thermophilum]|uniref:Uncharacterized protein n=1 Tax=Phialemonium thermophilum TaxID=223376 RepID=A0ABR3W1M9_9PEZI
MLWVFVLTGLTVRPADARRRVPMAETGPAAAPSLARAAQSDRGDGGTLTITKSPGRMARRETASRFSVCGYQDGDPERPRTAEPGFDCRVDTQNGLWGFCPTTVIAAADCGFAGSCLDEHECSDGCGRFGYGNFQMVTCSDGAPLCSTAVLTVDKGQTYSYIACGHDASVVHYQISPTAGGGRGETATATSDTGPPVAASTSTDEASTSSPPTAPSSSVPSVSATAPVASVSLTISTSPKSRPPVGAIVGGVLGGLAILCATALLGLYLLRKGRAGQPSAAAEPAGEDRLGPTSQVVAGKAQDDRLAGGWGPRELPADDSFVKRDVPVELAG